MKTQRYADSDKENAYRCIFIVWKRPCPLRRLRASSPKGRASGDSQRLLDTTDCESCTMILLWIWKQKTEYPLKTTTFRNHLAKNICFDKILTNENERNESRENTTKFKETAYAQNCPTDEKLAVHRPGGEHHCRGPAPHLERHRRPGRRQRLLAGHLRLPHPFCGSGL